MKKEKTNNKLLKDYMLELEEAVELNTINLREKSLMASSLQSKWLNYLFTERANLDRIIKGKQHLIKKKTESVSVRDSVLRLKSEDKLINDDETINRLNELQKITKDNVDYIERALDILSNFGYSIKNAIEIIKLTNN